MTLIEETLAIAKKSKPIQKVRSVTNMRPDITIQHHPKTSAVVVTYPYLHEEKAIRIQHMLIKILGMAPGQINWLERKLENGW